MTGGADVSTIDAKKGVVSHLAEPAALVSNYS
jgi:hypothetical protein